MSIAEIDPKTIKDLAIPLGFVVCFLIYSVCQMLTNIFSPAPVVHEAEEPDEDMLRDDFAMSAMQAVPMPQSHLHDIPAAYQRIAEHAYKMADAMLEARQQ